MKPELILIGGGGHCKACIDVVEQTDVYQITGIVDLPDKIGQKILGYEIIASDDDLPAFSKKDFYFLITVGQIEIAEKRIEIFKKLKSSSARLASVISPTAYVSRHAEIGQGTIVMHHALINAEAKIGRNCIINSKALVEHDAVVEDHCHISTGAIINGGVKVCSGTFVGSNSVTREYVNIGPKSTIGCGARVLKNVPSGSMIK